MTYVWPDTAALNEQLRSRILSVAEQQSSVQATNVGGWHSANGQLEFLEELREPLFQRVLLVTNEASGPVWRGAWNSVALRALVGRG